EVLSLALTTYGAQAAPSSLAAWVTTSALAAGTPAGGATLALLTMTNAKLATIWVIAIARALGPLARQSRGNRPLPDQKLALPSELVALRTSYEGAQKQTDTLGSEVNRLAKQDQEMARLRSALHDARQQLALLSNPKAAASQPSGSNDQPGPQQQPLSDSEVS